MHSQKRDITPERQDQRTKKKILVLLFFKYMAHIKFQDSSISGSGVSQLPNVLWTDRQTRIGSKVNQFIYTLVCNFVPNVRILGRAA